MNHALILKSVVWFCPSIFPSEKFAGYSDPAAFGVRDFRRARARDSRKSELQVLDRDFTQVLHQLNHAAGHVINLSFSVKAADAETDGAAGSLVAQAQCLEHV
jgi:hypothetical protein